MGAWVIGLHPLPTNDVRWFQRAPAWLAPDQPQLATILGFVALVPAGLLVFWRGARTASGFAVATALVYLAFFVFSKQAFANYYYFVIGALCCAVAAIRPPRTTHA